VLALVGESPLLYPERCAHVEEFTFGAEDLAGVSIAEPRGGLDDPIQDRLETHTGAAERVQDIRHRLLPDTDALKLPPELKKHAIIRARLPHRTGA